MVVEQVELLDFCANDFRSPQSAKQFDKISADWKTLFIVNWHFYVLTFQDESSVEALQVWNAKMNSVASQVVKHVGLVGEVWFELRVVVPAKLLKLKVNDGHEHAAFLASLVLIAPAEIVIFVFILLEVVVDWFDDFWVELVVRVPGLEVHPWKLYFVKLVHQLSNAVIKSFNRYLGFKSQRWVNCSCHFPVGRIFQLFKPFLFSIIHIIIIRLSHIFLVSYSARFVVQRAVFGNFHVRHKVKRTNHVAFAVDA